MFLEALWRVIGELTKWGNIDKDRLSNQLERMREVSIKFLELHRNEVQKYTGQTTHSRCPVKGNSWSKALVRSTKVPTQRGLLPG